MSHAPYVSLAPSTPPQLGCHSRQDMVAQRRRPQARMREARARPEPRPPPGPPRRSHRSACPPRCCSGHAVQARAASGRLLAQKLPTPPTLLSEGHATRVSQGAPLRRARPETHQMVERAPQMLAPTACGTRFAGVLAVAPACVLQLARALPSPAVSRGAGQPRLQPARVHMARRRRQREQLETQAMHLQKQRRGMQKHRAQKHRARGGRVQRRP